MGIITKKYRKGRIITKWLDLGLGTFTVMDSHG
jgi:hypothetical protein